MACVYTPRRSHHRGATLGKDSVAPEADRAKSRAAGRQTVPWSLPLLNPSTTRSVPLPAFSWPIAGKATPPTSRIEQTRIARAPRGDRMRCASLRACCAKLRSAACCRRATCGACSRAPPRPEEVASACLVCGAGAFTPVFQAPTACTTPPHPVAAVRCGSAACSVSIRSRTEELGLLSELLVRAHESAASLEEAYKPAGLARSRLAGAGAPQFGERSAARCWLRRRPVSE